MGKYPFPDSGDLCTWDHNGIERPHPCTFLRGIKQPMPFIKCIVSRECDSHRAVDRIPECFHAPVAGNVNRIPARFPFEQWEKVNFFYRIFVPGSTGFNGTRSDAASPAARIIPLLSIPKIFTGARLVTTTTSLPTSSSGL